MKIKHIILVLIFISLLIAGIRLSDRIVVLPKGDTYELLEHKFSDSYPNILNFSKINIGDNQIVYLNKYIDRDYDLSFIHGDTKQDKLNSIIAHVSEIPYSEFQNNPNDSSRGLNCQGYSLMIRDMCRQVDIPCKIVHTSNHMYDIVEVDNTKYKLDIVNGIMEELKQ